MSQDKGKNKRKEVRKSTIGNYELVEIQTKVIGKTLYKSLNIKDKEKDNIE